MADSMDLWACYTLKENGQWYYGAGTYKYWLHYAKVDRSLKFFTIGINLLALEAYELVGHIHG